MKKNLAFCLAVLMFILSACGQIVPKLQEPPTADIVQPTPTPQSTPAPTPTPTPEPTPAATPEPAPESTPEPTPEPIIDAAWWQENLPVMDGSTSLIPLEAGIRSALLEISMEEAEKQVAHTTTYGSFYNLIYTEAVDLIFSVPLSEEQMKQAADADVVLEQIPIAREGFVFVVNKNNPVDSLTQEQLRGIYSGEITNWSEVGGPDLPIIAYQRNNTSGSQNYMVDFMGDVPLMEAPSELRPGSMSHVIDVVAINDYAEQSIGYSVYSYVADMYQNSELTKFIAVDGVIPSKETMASGEYPLLSDSYAIFRADEPENSPVRRLCDWLVSEEGQFAIARSGYVPVMDIGYDYTQPEPPVPYSAVGCGSKVDEISLFECLAFSADSGDTSLPINVALPEDIELTRSTTTLAKFTIGIKYTVSCLTNDELEEKVNAWIADAVDKADASSADMYKFIDTKNQHQNVFYPCKQYFIHASNTQAYAPSAIVRVTARNGYLCAEVSQIYFYNDDRCYYYNTYCQVWDMYTCEEISVEALFPQDMDIDEYLNDLMRTAITLPMDYLGSLPNTKGDFTYLCEEGWTLSSDAIYFKGNNPHFVEGMRFSIIGYGKLCSEVFRSMDGLFDDSVVCTSLFKEMSYLPDYTYVDDGLFVVELLDESIGDTDIRAKINADVMSRANKLNTEAIVKFLKENGMDNLADHPEKLPYAFEYYGWGLKEYGERFAIFSASSIYFYEETKEILWPEAEICLIYDLQTGELLDWKELLVDNWQELAEFKFYNMDEFNGDLDSLPSLSMFHCIYYSKYYKLPLCIYLRDPSTDSACSIELPISALKAFSEIG